MMKPINIIDSDYTQWIKELSSRYRRSQIKAAVKVNQEMLSSIQGKHFAAGCCKIVLSALGTSFVADGQICKPARKSMVLYMSVGQ